jgi:hypothetical protein
MGRHEKSVLNGQGLDRRESGYYSTPAPVAEFLASKLVELHPQGRKALDPCLGEGELAIPLFSRGIAVDGFDVLDFDLPPGIAFSKRDFFDFYREQKKSCVPGGRIDLPYDFYVANPPYNCHELNYVRDNKRWLRSVFSDIGVLNTYSMFLSAMIDCAREGAILAFITLDSFLTARGHEALRKQILRECSLHHLLLCPNDLFWPQGADVRTCIMILQKGRRFQGEVAILNRPRDTTGFVRALEKESFEQRKLSEILLQNKEDRSEFIVGVPDDIRTLFAGTRLGSRFRCITGISTGNDSRYLSTAKRPGFTTPFYKNPGSYRFYCPPNAYLTDDFLQLDKSIPNFMVRNKELLFKPGITCSSMGVPFAACYLPINSTYGVNANIICPEKDLWWLLAYLNSHLVTYLVRGVLIRSNMVTSGYVSRIPVPKLSTRKKRALAVVAREAFRSQIVERDYTEYLTRINRALYAELGITPGSAEMMARFAGGILKLL